MAILTACAKPPQARMDGLRSGMELAELAESATYAPAEFEAAREAERTALAEVEAQNQKFALTRSFETAREMLDKAHRDGPRGGRSQSRDRHDHRQRGG